MEEKQKKERRGVNIPLLIIAILLFAIAGGITVHNLLQVNSANTALDEMVDGLEQAMEEQSAATQPPAEEAAEDSAETEAETAAEDDPLDGMPTFSWKDWTYIGWITIPDLDLHLPVMSTYSTELLAISPCRYYGSTTKGNLIIMGHNYSHHFGNLSKLKSGDIVTLTDADNVEWNYEVTELFTLKPTQTAELLEGDWDLTIFTCDTYGLNRIIVRCSQVE